MKKKLKNIIQIVNKTQKYQFDKFNKINNIKFIKGGKMKKILCLLTIFLFTLFTNVKASTNDSNVKIEWIPNVYYSYKKDNITYWGQLGYIYANNIISYCLDINQSINTDMYSSDTNINVNNLILLAGYFGYGYKNNNTVKDYMATQQLIWQYLGNEVKFTTKSKGEGETINVLENKKRIIKEINSFQVFPNIASNYNFDIGSTYKITDSNNKFKDLKLINNSKNDMRIEDNNLYITINEKGSNNFKFETTNEERFENKIFTSSNSQTIIQIGKINKLSNIYNYNVTLGRITINLLDIKTLSNISQGKSTLKGNIFELYNENNQFIGSFESNEEGKINIENLDLGKYKLKHITSKGYKLSDYEFEIKKDNINLNKDIFLEPIETKIEITKTYGNPKVGTIFYDEGIKFDIYNSKNELVETLTTNSFGECNTILIYDDYKIIQTNINNNEELNTFNISTEDFKEEYIYALFTPIYNARFKIISYDLANKNPMKNVQFYLNEDVYITNEEGYFITKSYEIGKYTLKETKLDNYLQNDDITINIDENSNFYIENGEVYIDVIVYNEKIEEKEMEQEKEIKITEELEVKANIEEIDKLPNLGITNNFSYLIIFFLGIKRVKKINI